MKGSFRGIALFLNLIFSATSTVWALEVPVLHKVLIERDCEVRVLVQKPPAPVPIKADVLFLIGFSDRADNHAPLFNKITRAGFRVISFDYPSHGETSCGSLDGQSFTTLMDLTEKVVAPFVEEVSRPLYLTGWSTGGLLALRLAQEKRFSSRKIAGLVLIAPGISVYKFPGEMGFVTQDSLLSNPNPPHMGPIQPISPLGFLFFGTALLYNSMLARYGDIPEVPILIFLGDDEADVYADSASIRDWVITRRGTNPQLHGIQCAGAKHELDNEIEPIGRQVRKQFTNFLLSPNEAEMTAGCPCVPF